MSLYFRNYSLCQIDILNLEELYDLIFIIVVVSVGYLIELRLLFCS